MGKVSSQFYGPAAPGFGNSSTWHPTIAWLLGFLVVEMIAFHMLSHFLNL